MRLHNPKLYRKIIMQKLPVGGILPRERQWFLNIQRSQFYAECDALNEGRGFWDIELREPCEPLED